MAIFAHDEALWQRFFNAAKVAPFRVMYEEMVQRPEETAVEVIRFLGIPVSEDIVFEPRRLKKQGDALSEKWVAQYSQWKREAGDGWTPRWEIRDPWREARVGSEDLPL